MGLFFGTKATSKDKGKTMLPLLQMAGAIAKSRVKGKMNKKWEKHGDIMDAFGLERSGDYGVKKKKKKKKTDRMGNTYTSTVIGT